MLRTTCRGFYKNLYFLLGITALHFMCTGHALDLFSRNRLSVVYNPRNLKYFANSTESATQIIIKDLDVILSIFSRVTLFPAHMEPEHQNYFHIILKDIATRNCKPKIKYNLPNVEVAVGWNFDSGSTFENITSEMKSLLFETNSICNDTVRLIILDCRDIAGDLSNIVDLLIKRLQYLRNNFQAANYKLAILLDDMICFDSAIALSSLFTHLDSIYFSNEYIGLLGVSAGTQSGKTAFNHFQNCTQYLRSKHIDIDIGFVTAFNEHPETKKLLKGCNLQTFWQYMDIWIGESNKTDVIIYEAYDNSNVISNLSFGYWNVSESKGGPVYHRKSYYWNDRCLEVNYGFLLLKPTTLIPQSTSSTTIETSTSQRESTTTSKAENTTEFYVAITAAVVCLLVIILVVIIVVYRKYTNKVDNTETELQNMLPENHPLLIPLSLPYDKVNYEFKPGTFTFDQSAILGEGIHGIVCEGTITKNGYIITAAVKTMKSSSKSEQLKAKQILLSEVKVLAYLGIHENILELLGACTESLKDGKILIFTEFCAMGSLDTILKDYKLRLMESRYVASSSDESSNSLISSNDSRESRIYLNDLERWSYEIANGMEYVASKNVVHADLATRNVLITEKKQVKIADFGLSRKLYNFTHYKKTHEDYLPLRWMAPEALSLLIFNEKTDAWSYGITIWEIFTFGKLPFSQIKHLDRKDMAAAIENNLKLKAPKHNPENIYELMQECWRIKPDERPNFAKIKSILLEKFQNLDSS